MASFEATYLRMTSITSGAKVNVPKYLRAASVSSGLAEISSMHYSIAISEWALANLVSK
jgi:hypothetical protein